MSGNMILIKYRRCVVDLTQQSINQIATTRSIFVFTLSLDEKWGRHYGIKWVLQLYSV